MACSGNTPTFNPGAATTIVANVAQLSADVRGTGGQSAVAATGSIVCIVGANINDGETFTINDGHGNTIVFEFDVGGGGVGGGNTAVVISAADTAVQVADAVRAAINASALQITASGATATVVLTNDNLDDEGNQAITETVVNSSFTVSGMSGGSDDPDSTNFTLGVYMKKGSAPTFLIGERIASISMSWESLNQTKTFSSTYTINDNSEAGDFYFRYRIECEGSDFGGGTTATEQIAVPYFSNSAPDFAVEFGSDLTVSITANVVKDTEQSGYYIRMYRKLGSQPTYQPSELVNTQTVPSTAAGTVALTYNDTIPSAGNWYYKARIELIGGSYTGGSVTDQNGGDYIVKTPIFTGSELALTPPPEFGNQVTVVLTGDNLFPLESSTGHKIKVYRKKGSVSTFDAADLNRTLEPGVYSQPFSASYIDTIPSAGHWYYIARMEITTGAYSGGDTSVPGDIDVPSMTTTGIGGGETPTPYITTPPETPPTAVPHEGIDELIVLVRPTGTPAGGITFADVRYLSTTYQKAEWKYHRRGGCGWFRLMLREDFPESSQALDEGWEIHIRIRLPAEVDAALDAGQPEPAYTTWYRGVIRSVTYNQSGNEKLCDIQGWGYSEQMQKIQVQKKYPAGLQVRDIVLDIFNNFVRPYSRILRGDSLDPTNFNIDPATYKTQGEIFFECNAYKALKLLAELQGGIEYGVDANRIFYWKQTSSNVQKNFYGNKDSVNTRSGSRSDEKTNQLKIEGTHFGARELLKIRPDVTDITANGLFEVPVELPWIGNDQDASRWADNMIAEWKYRRDWRLISWQDIDKRLENSHPIQKVQYMDAGDVTLVPSAFLINRIHYTKGGFQNKGEVREIGAAKQQSQQDQVVLRAEVFMGGYPGDMLDELETINDQVEALKGKGKQFRLPPDVTVLNRDGYIPGELVHYSKDVTNNDVANNPAELQNAANPRGILLSWLSKQWTKISLRRTVSSLPARGYFLGEIISLITDPTLNRGDLYYWDGSAWYVIAVTGAGAASSFDPMTDPFIKFLDA